MERNDAEGVESIVSDVSHREEAAREKKLLGTDCPRSISHE